MRVAAEPLAKAAKRLSRWASGPLTTPVAVLEAEDGQLSLRVKGPAGWFVEQVQALEPEPEVEAEAQGPEPPWGLTADPAKLESILSGIRRRQELELQLVGAPGRERLEITGEALHLLDPNSGLGSLAEAGQLPELTAEERWCLELPAERLARLLALGSWAAAKPEANAARAQLILQARDEQASILATDGRVLVEARALLTRPAAEPLETVLPAIVATRLAELLKSLPELAELTLLGLADGSLLVECSEPAVSLLLPAVSAPEPPAIGAVVSQLAGRQVLAQLDVNRALRDDVALLAGHQGTKALLLRPAPASLVASSRHDLDLDDGTAVVSLPAETPEPVPSEAVLLDAALLHQALGQLAGETIELSCTDRLVCLDQLSEAAVSCRVVLLRQQPAAS